MAGGATQAASWAPAAVGSVGVATRSTSWAPATVGIASFATQPFLGGLQMIGSTTQSGTTTTT
jgi:hypothetical protein